MAGKNIPFLRGKNSTITFFLGGVKQVIDSKTYSITRNVTKHDDPVNGEDRNRVDSSTNHFDVAIDVYGTDAKLLEAFINEQQVQDDGALPLDVASGISIKPRDGSKFAVACTEGCVDDWNFTMGGRTEAAMYKIPLRYRYVKKVPL